MGLLGCWPQPLKSKRLLLAVLGGYGLFLHSALTHHQDVASDSPTNQLLSRALLRSERPAPPLPRYEAQAIPPEPAGGRGRGADEAPLEQQQQQQQQQQQPPLPGDDDAEAADAATAATPPISSRESDFWKQQEAALRSLPDYASLTSTAPPAQPLRSAAEMARTQECFRRFLGVGYLLHMRKAGGTSLRKFLDNWVIQREEATGQRHRIHVTEGATFNLSCWRDQGEFLSITSLRHPIARILSSYWFEGRRHINPPHLVPGTSGLTRAALLAGDDEDDSGDDEEGEPRTLQEWVRRVRRDEYLRWAVMTRRQVWVSVDNYYCKTLTNRFRPSVHAPITRRDFELAKRILASFDLVMITEWMGWRNQTDYVKAVLGGPLPVPVADADANQEEEEQQPQPPKPRLHKSLTEITHMNQNQLGAAARADEAAAVDEATLRELWQENRWDLLLYDYAQQLVRQRMAEHYGDGGGATGVAGGVTAAERRRLREAEGVECRAPVNDPDWRGRGQDVDKPNRDSFLYTSPFCLNNDYTVTLDHSLDIRW